MALVVFLQEDEDVLSVYHNLKISCETAPQVLPSQSTKASEHKFEHRGYDDVFT